MYKPNRDTKIPSEVSGALENSWDTETYTVTILIHSNISSVEELEVACVLPGEQSCLSHQMSRNTVTLPTFNDVSTEESEG